MDQNKAYKKIIKDGINIYHLNSCYHLFLSPQFRYLDRFQHNFKYLNLVY